MAKRRAKKVPHWRAMSTAPSHRLVEVLGKLRHDDWRRAPFRARYDKNVELWRTEDGTRLLVNVTHWRPLSIRKNRSGKVMSPAPGEEPSHEQEE